MPARRLEVHYGQLNLLIKAVKQQGFMSAATASEGALTKHSHLIGNVRPCPHNTTSWSAEWKRFNSWHKNTWSERHVISCGSDRSESIRSMCDPLLAKSWRTDHLGVQTFLCRNACGHWCMVHGSSIIPDGIVSYQCLIVVSSKFGRGKDMPFHNWTFHQYKHHSCKNYYIVLVFWGQSNSGKKG